MSKMLLRWDCSTKCFKDDDIVRGLDKFVRIDVEDDFVPHPCDIVIDKNRYRTDDDYRDATTQTIKAFEDELRRWYYGGGWRLGTTERKTLYGWNEPDHYKPTQAMKTSRRDLWFDRGLKRTARIDARIEHAIAMFNYARDL